MPEAVAKPASALKHAHFINEFLNGRIAEPAVNIIIVFSRKAARISSAFSKQNWT